MSQLSPQNPTPRPDGLSRYNLRPRGTNATEVPMPLHDRPPATFLGLAVEIRLEIYAYIFKDELIHLEYVPKDDKHPSRFIWRPCRATDPCSTLLCKTPSWADARKPEHQCLYRDAAHKNTYSTFPLQLVCKAIHRELKAVITELAAISLPYSDFDSFINITPKFQLSAIRRLTLYGDCISRPDVGNWAWVARRKTIGWGTAPRPAATLLFPNLQQLAFQGLDTFCTSTQQLSVPASFSAMAYFRDVVDLSLKCDRKLAVVRDPTAEALDALKGKFIFVIQARGIGGMVVYSA